MEAQELGSPSSVPLSISIGQVPLALHVFEERLLEQAGRRYAEFRDSNASALPVFLVPGRTPATENARFAYQLDEASLELGEERVEFRGVRHEYALDSLLRVLLSALLLPRQGFLLHAASVERDGGAYVFTGQSGAGKSTVASLSPAGTVLTDEISLLRSCDGIWAAHGTPFWGEFRAAGSNRRVPLAGIYRLVQSRENRLVRLTAKQAVRALLPNILFFSSGTRESEDLLQLLTQIAEQVPCFELHFRRDATFWEVVAP